MSPQTNSAVAARVPQIRQQNWSGIFDAVQSRLFAQVEPTPVPVKPRLRVKSSEVAGMEALIRKQAEDLRCAMAAGYPGEPETCSQGKVAAALSHAYRGISRPVISRKPFAAGLRASSSRPSKVQESVKQEIPSVARQPMGFWDECQLIARQPTPSRQRTTCDRCDGPHATDRCPHFKKPREQHKDAWTHYGSSKHPKGLQGTTTARVFKRHGHCVSQPGDGDCLFHALCHGLNAGVDGQRTSARELRRELAGFVGRNGTLDIAGDTIEEWVRWDSNSSVAAYAGCMAYSGWGGGLEMAACSRLKGVSIHVYEACGAGFQRISCFDHQESKPSGKSRKTINLLYQGGVHYNALVFD